jgi:4-amino-4-deoxy-L-arabinose transferase-like glycosyltransferase
VLTLKERFMASKIHADRTLMAARGPRLRARAGSRAAWLAVVWLLAALGLYLLGNGQNSLWDRDEPRFAGAAREMIATGNWIVPRFNASNRYDKPVLIYWCMAAAMRSLGANEFSARLPSSLAGAGVVALVFWLARRMGCSSACASVAALVVMLSPQVFWLSKAATADALLLLTIAGAMTLYWEQRQSGFSWWRHLGFWVLLGASVLTKGPPGPAIVGSAVVCDQLWHEIARRRSGKGIGAGIGEQARQPWAGETVEPRGGASKLGDGVTSEYSGAPAARFSGVQPVVEAGFSPPLAGQELPIPSVSPVSAVPRWENLLTRVGAGLLIFLAIVMPWVWAAWTQTHGEYFGVLIGHHVVERSLSPLDAHKGPFWYYLPVLLLATFPATALVLTALGWALHQSALREVRLLWCWLVPGVIMFSLARTKLPHYIAPVIPAMALMSGLWWSGDAPGSEGRSRGSGGEGGRRSAALVGALMGAALGAGLAVVPRLAGLPALRAPLALAGASLILSSIVGGACWWRQWRAQAVVAWTAGTLAAMVILLTWALPALEPLRPSPDLARWLLRNAPPGTRVAAGYEEPSLVFYWGRPIRELGKEEGAMGLGLLRDTTTPTALVTDAKEWNEWLAASRLSLPPRVRVRYARRFYLLEKGRWSRLLVIGNW